MSDSLSILVDFDHDQLLEYSNVRDYSCREVLLKDIEDKSYSGDFSSVISQESLKTRLTQASVKILRLLKHIAVLKEMANSCTPIHGIPAEILLQIFQLCTYRHELSNDKRWLAFSQVCKRWRRLAHGDPSLWTDLDYSNPRTIGLVKMMARRAHPVPVSVKVSFDNHDLFHLLPPRAQIGSIMLYCWRVSELPVTVHLQDFFSGLFPDMETLRIVCDASHRSTAYNMERFEAPRLRALIFHDWCLRDWNAPFIVNLTHLELKFNMGVDPVENHVLPSTAMLFTILRRNIRLVSLTLLNAINESHHETDALEVVRFDYLRDFDVKDRLIVLERLLHHLVAPSLDVITVHVYDSDIVHDHYERLCQGLHHCLNSATWTALRGDVRCHYNCFRLDFYIESSPSRLTNNHHLKMGLFAVGGEPEETSPLSYLLPLCDPLPSKLLSDLKFCVTAQRDISQTLDDVWHALAELPALKSIELTKDDELHGNDDWFGDFAVSTIDPGIRESEREIWMSRKYEYYPALQVLTFRNFNMTVACSATFGNQASVSRLAVVEAFHDCTLAQGRPVKIVLIDCYIHTHDIQRLRADEGKDIEILTTAQDD